MKQHKELVRFKNSFLPAFLEPESLNRIIQEDFSSAVSTKIKQLVKLYRRTAAEVEYNSKLAYRVITLCLVTHNTQLIAITDELSRFFRHCLDSKTVDKIGLCFDLLLLKQTSQEVKEQQRRVLKVRLMRGLYGCYSQAGKRDDRNKCGYTLREYCKESLLRDCVKHCGDVYEEILDGLIELTKLRVCRLVRRGSRIRAAEQLTDCVCILEKSQKVISTKYQCQLMEAYWSLAQLHHQLHYLAYARKYTAIALNIAQRLEHPQAVQSLTALTEAIS